MKKRSYRAVAVKGVDKAKLSDALNNAPVVVGVDVAKEDFFAAIMDEQRVVQLTVKWKHPFETPGFIELLGGLNASSVEVAMEPSGTYGDPLRSALWAAGIPVFRVSPKRAHDAAEVYDGVPSHHDAKSAAIVAKLHWDHASEKWPVATDAERSFRAVTKTMVLYQKQFRQNVNRLEAELARYWPELSHVLELGSATLLALLAEMGGPHKVAAHPEESRELMRRTGGQFLKQSKIEQVIDDAVRSLGVESVDGELAALKELARDTQRARKEMRRAQTAVERLSQNEPSVARMGAVVGKVTSAVLVSEAGAPQSYRCAAAYQKSLGLNLKERSSGKHKGRLKITKRGSGTGRQYLYLATLRLIQNDEVVKAWYEKKVRRDGGVKLKAIVAIMRKLARALWYVARGDRFDSTKLFDVRRLKRQLVA